MPAAEFPRDDGEPATADERKAILRKIEEHRAIIYVDILALEKNRTAVIDDGHDLRKADKDAFDTQVPELLRKQVKRSENDY